MVKYFFYAALIWLLLSLFPPFLNLRMSDQNAAGILKEHTVNFRFLHYEENGVTIHAVAAGDDSHPVLLLIHGSPGSWNAFIDYLTDSALLAHYYVVAPDRPGFGQSQLGKPVTDFALQARALSPLLQLGTSPLSPLVAGHSLGAPIAGQLAMDHPEGTGALVLISGSIDPALEPDEWFRPLLAQPVIRSIIPAELHSSNMELMYTPQELIEMEDRWQEITCATLIIHGKNDQLVPVGNVAFGLKKLEAVWKDTLLFDKNHFIPWTCKDSIIQVFLEMKDKLPEKTPSVKKASPGI